MTKAEIEELKLNEEENNQLNTFLGKCVRSNQKFTLLTNRVAISPSFGIQEVYSQTSDTLITYAGLLHKQITTHVVDFNPLAKGEKAFMVNGLKGQTILDMLQLIIREKAYSIAMNSKANQLEQAKAQLEDLKTPEERKSEILARIAELEK